MSLSYVALRYCKKELFNCKELQPSADGTFDNVVSSLRSAAMLADRIECRFTVSALLLSAKKAAEIYYSR